MCGTLGDVSLVDPDEETLVLWRCDIQLLFYASGFRGFRINVKRFRGGLVFEAHRLLYHSTLGLRVIKKKEKKMSFTVQGSGFRVQGSGSRVRGSGFRVQGAGCRVQGSGSRVRGSGFRVQGSGFRDPGLVCHGCAGSNKDLCQVFFFFFITLKPRVE